MYSHCLTLARLCIHILLCTRTALSHCVVLTLLCLHYFVLAPLYSHCLAPHDFHPHCFALCGHHDWHSHSFVLTHYFADELFCTRCFVRAALYSHRFKLVLLNDFVTRTALHAHCVLALLCSRTTLFTLLCTCTALHSHCVVLAVLCTHTAFALISLYSRCFAVTLLCTYTSLYSHYFALVLTLLCAHTALCTRSALYSQCFVIYFTTDTPLCQTKVLCGQFNGIFIGLTKSTGRYCVHSTSQKCNISFIDPAPR